MSRSTGSLGSVDSRTKSHEKRLTGVQVDGLTRMVQERHLQEIFEVYGKVQLVDLPKFRDCEF